METTFNVESPQLTVTATATNNVIGYLTAPGIYQTRLRPDERYQSGKTVIIPNMTWQASCTPLGWSYCFAQTVDTKDGIWWVVPGSDSEEEKVKRKRWKRKR